MEILSSGLRPYIVLTALCACLFLTGLGSVPPTDRDEARFMQATKQMLESGDVITIRFQDELRTKKPVGIHWLQVLFVKALAGGDVMAVWAYRLPSVMASWLTVLCTFVLGRRLFDAKAGLLAAILTASTLIMVVEAHLAKTDAVLLLTIVLAHMALAEFYFARDNGPLPFRFVFMFWMAVGLGVLTKGPVPLAVIAATITALCLADRNARWLHKLQPVVGVPIAAACVLPWILLSSAAGQGDVISASLTEDFLPKLIGGEEGHGAPPGTYAVLSPLLLWPASLILLPGLVWAWKKREQPQIRFVLGWAFATWLMFEAVPTKLPHYVLPAIPAIALAAAGSFVGNEQSIPRSSKAVWCLVALLLTVGLAGAAWAYGGPVVTTGLILMILFGAAIQAWRSYRVTYVFIPAVAISVFGLVFGGYLSQLTHLTLSTRLSDSIRAHGDGPVALTRYREPSAVYLLGTGTWLTNVRNAAAHIAADPSALAIVAEDELEMVWEMVAATNRDVIILDHIEGYNYAKGRRETLVVLRSEQVAN